MKKILKIVAIFVICLVLLLMIGGYIVLNQINFNKYTDTISKIARDATGRELVIGDVQVKVSLYPTIELKNVTFSNAKWAKSPIMVSAEAVDLSFAVLPLLSKNVVINKFSINNAVVNLEENKNGENNWTFEKKEDAVVIKNEKTSFNWSLIKTAEASEIVVKDDDLSEILSSFVIKNVVLDGVKVSYIDKNSKEQIYNVKKLSLDEAENDNIDFSFDVNNGYYQGTGSVGSLKKIASGERFPLDANLNVMGINVDAAFVVSDVLNDLNFSGGIKSSGFMGKNSAYNEKAEIDIVGNLKKIDAVIKSLEIAGNIVTGNVNVILDKKIPNIKAILNSSNIDIASFKKKNVALKEFSLIKSANATTLVGTQLVPYNELRAINGNIDINIAQVMNGSSVLAKNIKAQAMLNNGVAEFKILNGVVSGGEISGVIGVNGSNKSAYANINAVNVNLASLMNVLDLSSDSFKFNSGSQTDLHINVVGKGDTYADIIDGLNGQVVGIVDKSVLHIGSINKITGNVISQLFKALNLAKESDDLNVRCAVVRADITDGKAVFPNGIVLNSDKFTVVANGDVNLKKDKLNLSIKPFSGKITDTNIASALSSLVKLTGTIQKPKIGIDSASAIKTIVGVTAAGPVYFGAQMLIENDGAPCYTALQNTPYINKFPKPKGSGNIAGDSINNAISEGTDVVKGTTEGVAKVLNDSVGIVKGTTKGIFNILSGGASSKAN